jgi:hypothetical protein
MPNEATALGAAMAHLFQVTAHWCRASELISFARVTAMDDLASYLMARVPNGMIYSDAVQLCLRLYCTVDGVPGHLLPLSKELLGDTFAKLGSAGWVRNGVADSHEVIDSGHWVQVMSDTLKKGAHIVDMGRGEVLARQVGFVCQQGPS